MSLAEDTHATLTLNQAVVDKSNNPQYIEQHKNLVQKFNNEKAFIKKPEKFNDFEQRSQQIVTLSKSNVIAREQPQAASIKTSVQVSASSLPEGAPGANLSASAPQSTSPGKKPTAKPSLQSGGAQGDSPVQGAATIEGDAPVQGAASTRGRSILGRFGSSTQQSNSIPPPKGSQTPEKKGKSPLGLFASLARRTPVKEKNISSGENAQFTAQTEQSPLNAGIDQYGTLQPNNLLATPSNVPQLEQDDDDYSVRSKSGSSDDENGPEEFGTPSNNSTPGRGKSSWNALAPLEENKSSARLLDFESRSFTSKTSQRSHDSELLKPSTPFKSPRKAMRVRRGDGSLYNSEDESDEDDEDVESEGFVSEEMRQKHRYDDEGNLEEKNENPEDDFLLQETAYSYSRGRGKRTRIRGNVAKSSSGRNKNLSAEYHDNYLGNISLRRNKNQTQNNKKLTSALQKHCQRSSQFADLAASVDDETRHACLVAYAFCYLTNPRFRYENIDLDVFNYMGAAESYTPNVLSEQETPLWETLFALSKNTLLLVVQQRINRHAIFNDVGNNKKADALCGRIITGMLEKIVEHHAMNTTQKKIILACLVPLGLPIKRKLKDTCSRCLIDPLRFFFRDDQDYPNVPDNIKLLEFFETCIAYTGF